MDFCIYDEIVDMIQITDKRLLHFKLSKLGQILHVDETCFPRPGHNSCFITTIRYTKIYLKQAKHTRI